MSRGPCFMPNAGASEGIRTLDLRFTKPTFGVSFYAIRYNTRTALPPQITHIVANVLSGNNPWQRVRQQLVNKFHRKA